MVHYKEFEREVICVWVMIDTQIKIYQPFYFFLSIEQRFVCFTITFESRYKPIWRINNTSRFVFKDGMCVLLFEIQFCLCKIVVAFFSFFLSFVHSFTMFKCYGRLRFELNSLIFCVWLFLKQFIMPVVVLFVVNVQMQMYLNLFYQVIFLWGLELRLYKSNQNIRHS